MSEKCRKFQLNYLVEEQTDFNLLSFIKSKGKSVFLYEGFNTETVTSESEIYLQTELKQLTETQVSENGITQIIFFPKESFVGKLKLSEKYVLIFYKEKSILKFDIVSYNFLKKGTEKSKFTLTSVINNSHLKEISQFIYDSISKEYFKKNLSDKPDYENVFIEKTSLNEYILLSELTGSEKLLCKLNFNTAKKQGSPDKIKNIKTGCIAASENHFFLIMLNENDDLIECSELTKPISVKKNILNNSVEAGDYIIYPKRLNSNLFSYLSNIQELKGNKRIRKIAEINTDEKKYAGAENLYQFLIDKENHPLDYFLMFLNKYKNSDTIFEDFISTNDISKILNDVLKSEKSETVLNDIFTGNSLSFDEKIMLLQLFADTTKEPDEQQKILPFYENLRKIFLKKNKDLINKTVFDIKYVQFLIRSGYKRKARKILNELLKHLPDETISDLLPPENLDLTSDKSGQLLKTTVLDLLAEAKDKEDAQELVQKTALLQPLNENRIGKLAAVGNSELKKRADEARNILNGNGLFVNDNPVCRVDYFPPDNSLINKYLQHPAVLKKGSFYNLQKWISEIKADDYSSVRKYSEKISSETYNTLFAVLKNAGEVFGFKDIEFYITKGDRNDEIIGYEGNPPFVIIGYDYLNKTSDTYMNLSELQFTVASEISHIFFKHTKLTSKDVWRGLIEKGVFVADAALAVIPVAGFLAKTLKNVPKLNLLTKIFQGTANSIAGGKSAYDAALRLTEYYGKKGKTKKEKQKSLLAASRLMQNTADRAGLLVCGNLASAVRVVLLTEKFDKNPIEEIKTTSLKEFLLKQNNDGTFKYQKTALRIANLFSFYFSEEYALLRKKMEKGK